MRHQEDIPAELDELIRFGTVAAVDLGAGRIVVDSGDVQTSNIRWVEGKAGKTRTWSPPSVGEQVLLLCPTGEIFGAIALRGVSQEAFPFPGNSLRELIEFEDGAVIAYDPEAHHLDVTLPAGATAAIVARGGVVIDATDGGLEIKGDLTVRGQVKADDDVIAGGISLQTHKHKGVQAGTAQTQEPV